MKRYILAIVLVIAGIIVFQNNPPEPPATLKKQIGATSEDTSLPEHDQADSVSGSIFVPYWTIQNATSINDIALPKNASYTNIDYLIYFGVSPTSTGINTSDPGYTNLSQFVELTGDSNQHTLLTVRMIDTEINQEILEDDNSQNIIIDEVLNIAKNNGFDGIVLDLEHSVLPTEKVTTSITDFIKRFSSRARSEDLVFAMTLYGDTYYRARPYNVTALEPHVDNIMIMTYDFHKSFGTPGPNFPLAKSDTYEYSVSDLVHDLYNDKIPPEKLTFIFGLYGYDWLVDEKNRPIRRAEPVTLNQARSRYSSKDITIDSVSGESNVTFADDEGTRTVWFETEESAAKKTKFLMEQGISKVGYWAWGYY